VKAQGQTCHHETEAGAGARYLGMKTVRFTKLVQECGAPKNHLVLADPEKDTELQRAAKAKRVVTVLQENVGTKADHGVVALEVGPGRQYLLFPKSLKAHAGAGVVGIKYDLIHEPKIPKSQQAKIVIPKKKRPAKKPKPALEEAAPKLRVQDEPAKPATELKELKTQVKKAMVLLERGKTVAAFNLLSRAVDEG
jgi:hypothetical protein